MAIAIFLKLFSKPYLGLAEYIDRTWRSLGDAIAPGEGKVQNKQVE